MSKRQRIKSPEKSRKMEQQMAEETDERTDGRANMVRKRQKCDVRPIKWSEETAKKKKEIKLVCSESNSR